VEQVFIGGTAERLLDRVECDLLVVKPPGFRSPLA
jgi:nucleotide-binding universal stress UspA family protein